MANIEYNYTTKVKDLEEENNRLQQRISYHTETEQRLKQSLKTSGKNDSQSYGELLERLMETEKAELAMKEKVYYLEKSERELNLKLLEEQKVTSDLKNEIKDQEDLMAQMESMDSENKRLNQNMNRLKEIEFKYQETQQSEDFLHGRVEELEQTENSLRETISVIEQSSIVKEKKMQDQMSRLREEIQHQNHSASSYEDAYDRLRGQDDSLKMELDNLKEKVTELTCELNQKSVQYQETEASLRSEVSFHVVLSFSR
jgi:chromosome segregation ATPase